jgi:hypothetical protein
MKNGDAIEQARDENVGRRSGCRRGRSDHMQWSREARYRQVMCATAHVKSEHVNAIARKKRIVVTTQQTIFEKNPRRAVLYTSAAQNESGRQQCTEDWSPGKSGSADRKKWTAQLRALQLPNL